MAADESSSAAELLAAASVFCDIMKAVALFAVAAAAANRRRAIFWLSLWVFAMCSLWSLRSATHFGASVISGKIAAAERNEKIEASLFNLVDVKTRRAGFLAQQSILVDVKNKYAREDALNANQRSSAEFKDIVSSIEKSVSDLRNANTAPPDPVAKILAGIVNEDVYVFASAGFFALLLEFVSSFGFLMLAQSRIPHPHNYERDRERETIENAKPTQEALPDKHHAHPDVYRASTSSQTHKVGSILSVRRGVVTLHPTHSSAHSNTAIRTLDEHVCGVVRDKFEYDADARILLRDVTAQINAELPAHRRVVEAHKIAKHVVPAVYASYPGVV